LKSLTKISRGDGVGVKIGYGEAQADRTGKFLDGRNFTTLACMQSLRCKLGAR